MPSVSKKQRRFLGADLQRKREGKPTRTGMTEKQLSEFAGTSERGLPLRKRQKGGDTRSQSHTRKVKSA